MSLGRAILCFLLPPLAVLDKGCGSVLLVLLLTLVGWVPGILAALLICTREPAK
ncbi:MAG TPA: YqaE/Pmp3 family membrane protein [Chthoniobacteraceae bacterium]|nr:YqaE/Pmp3 family membrane protein [Chthoniobacteraceae bacterium]